MDFLFAGDCSCINVVCCKHVSRWKLTADHYFLLGVELELEVTFQFVFENA